MRTAAVSVVILLTLVSCKTDGGKGVVLEASLEKLIPNDTVILTGVRMETLKNTPLFQRLEKQQKITALDDFVRQTHLDPRKDLREIVVASTGKEVVAIARVDLADPANLEKLLEEKGARRVAAGKYTLMATADQNAVCFVGNKLAIAGRLDLVQQLVQGQAGDDQKKRAVLNRVAKLPDEKQIWAVAVGGFSPVKLPDTGNLANLLQVFSRLEAFTLTVDVKEGVYLTASGQCLKPEDAKQLHDLLRGLIGFGRLSTPSDRPEFLRFFDGIKVENADRTVKINADVPKDMVDLFLTLSGAGGKPKV
ncbi:MAG: hypothetical protein HY820_40005 [Acidobacteria bacterium]|nr:hypothetical protein [Acidobacteriota bacterium]